MAPGARPVAGDASRGEGVASRLAALRLLAGVLDDGRTLDSLIDDNAALHGLSPPDRAFARALASTALRRRGQIRAILAELIDRPLPRRAGLLPHILELAATQLLFMDVPDHAAVATALSMAETDRNARHFKPLANGVLRNLTRRREELLLRHGAAVLNVPEWLKDRWHRTFGDERTEAIAAAHLVEAPLDLSAKSNAAALAERLSGELLPTGTIRCRAKGRVEELAGYADGAWWVQDAAAALPARLLGDVAGKDVLDLCAAPGGKTAVLAAAGANVTAVDISSARVDRLRSNLARLGLAADCVVADALRFDPGRLFDAVLVDAPCSATGTIRRHPDIPWLKTEADIAPLTRIQRGLMANAARLVRPGGTLVFATCSLEPEEGEQQAAAALADLPLAPRPISPGEIPGLAAEWLSNGHLRTLPFFPPGPGISGGMDGFFAARFVKA